MAVADRGQGVYGRSDPILLIRIGLAARQVCIVWLFGG